MIDYQFEICLEIKGPLLCKGLAAASLGVDASSFQFGGTLAILGSHLKGHLRECLMRLKTMRAAVVEYQIKDWLGAESTAGTNEPARARLQFPFVLSGPASANSKRYRVKIEPGAMASADQALMQIESGLAPNQTAKFKGTIVGRFATESEAKTCADALSNALNILDAVGSLKGIGFGQVVQAALSCKQATPIAITGTADSEFLKLRFDLDRPFCFGKKEGRQNALESKDYVPGAAILGAIYAAAKHGQTIESWQAHVLSKAVVTCSHAYVLDQHQQRQTPMPLSLVFDENRFIDAIDKSANQFTAALRFKPDWKPKTHADLAKRLGHQSLDELLLIRTAIEEGKAKDEQLFAYQCVDAKQHQFEAVLHVPDRKARQAVLALLPFALRGLGKTEACALQIALSAHAPDDPPRTGPIYVRLLSDAWIDLDLNQVPASNGHAQLLAAYQAKFKDKGLTLTHFFASQRYDGGAYLHKRFQQPGAYKPYLITEAGSVFAFVVNNASEAAKTLAAWAKHGMQTEKDEDDWQRNPYRRENGYGEVRISSQAFAVPDNLAGAQT